MSNIEIDEFRGFKLKNIKMSLAYYFGWSLFLIIWFFFGVLLFGIGIDGGIIWKIICFPISFLILMFIFLVIFLMFFFYINGRIKYENEYFLIKDIYRKIPNPFSFRYRKIKFSDIEDYRYIHGYKEEKLHFTLKDRRKYGIGALGLRDDEWYEFVEKVKESNDSTE
jgi:hypothetical protein